MAKIMQGLWEMDIKLTISISFIYINELTGFKSLRDETGVMYYKSIVLLLVDI